MKANAFFPVNLDNFATDAAAIDARLRARPSRLEFFALGLTAGTVILFTWVHNQINFLPFDYNIYIEAANGNLLQYYYADWLLPLFKLWAMLPYTWGYVLWAFLNIACVFFAGRVFGGQAALALLTFQMFYSLFLGQITGLLVGGLALGWWGLAHQRWHIAGLGFWLASTKFQIGLPFGLLLWLMADTTWRQRLRVLVLPAILSALSLALYPGWPLALIQRVHEFPPYDWASISLWHWIGPVALLLWLPPLLLPMRRPKRFLALAATIPLSLPYFQQADLLALYVLPLGWLPVVLGNVGFLFFKFHFDVLRLLWLVPLTVYLAVLLPAGYAWLRKRRSFSPPDKTG